MWKVDGQRFGRAISQTDQKGIDRRTPIVFEVFDRLLLQRHFLRLRTRRWTTMRSTRSPTATYDVYSSLPLLGDAAVAVTVERQRRAATVVVDIGQVRGGEIAAFHLRAAFWRNHYGLKGTVF